MGSITLTNIPQFIEQPGRTITRTIGELDRMTVKFLGPWYVEVPFKQGSPDTQYPLMFCSGWGEVFNGGLKEVSVNYAGRIDNSWKTEALVTLSASEKELSYTELTSFSTRVTAGSGAFITTSFQTTYALNNFCLHYVGEIVTTKYVVYGIPEPMVAQSATIYSQYTVHTGVGSQITPSGGLSITQQFPGPYGYDGPFQRITQFSFVQIIDQWYQCSTSLEARYEVH